MILEIRGVIDREFFDGVDVGFGFLTHKYLARSMSIRRRNVNKVFSWGECAILLLNCRFCRILKLGRSLISVNLLSTRFKAVTCRKCQDWPSLCKTSK